MSTAYRLLAWLLALEVVIQAGAIAFAVFGLTRFVDEGGAIDAAAIESGVEFTGVIGFPVHALNGMFLIPLIALLLLIVSFFARVPRGVPLAAVAFGLVVLQVFLGIFGHGITSLGLLHGVNALAVFMVAGLAARAASVPTAAPRAQAGSVPAA